MNTKTKSLPGLSLVFSVVLTSVIVLFSIGVTTLVTDTTRQASNIKQGTTAYYSAESGLEQALWVNKKLADTTGTIGANTNTSTTGLTGTTDVTKFKIQGSTTNLVDKTVNGKYIIPFPWTGDVPWHGDGSVANTGGCNPEKPPVYDSAGKFSYKYLVYDGTTTKLVPTPASDNIEYHPCNWNKIAVGEKASIPLYGLDDSKQPVSFTSFTLRVRTPCINGNEMCPPGTQNLRMDLNCYDKGDSKIRCVPVGDIQYKDPNYMGEVVMLWQIDGQDKTTKETKSLLPRAKLQAIENGYVDFTDSQLFEGRVNRSDTSSAIYEVLTQSKTGTFYGDTISNPSISTFLGATYNLEKPVLKLSVVGGLYTCVDPVACQYAYDYPYQTDGKDNASYKAVKIPYLEYQLIFTGASGAIPPTNVSNVISAEGQSGPFNQTIQVKVPNDNSSLEYVIQQ